MVELSVSAMAVLVKYAILRVGALPFESDVCTVCNAGALRTHVGGGGAAEDRARRRGGVGIDAPRARSPQQASLLFVPAASATVTKL